MSREYVFTMTVFCPSASGISSSTPSLIVAPPNEKGTIQFSSSMILLVGNRLLRAKPSWRRFPPRRIISSLDRMVSFLSGGATTPHRESPCRSLLVRCHSAWCNTRALPLVLHHASWHPKHPHGILRMLETSRKHSQLIIQSRTYLD